MKRFTFLLALAVVLLVASGALADKALRKTHMGYGTLHGGPANVSKSRADTIMVMGPRQTGATWSYYGNFQNETAGPDWNDWIHWDHTADTTRSWSVSTYNADNLNGHGAGNRAAWCGRDYPSCDASDPAGGYGNNWYTWIEWTYEVPDTNAVQNTAIDFWINYDLDPVGSGDDEDLIDVIALMNATYDSTGFATIGEFRGSGTNEHASFNYRYYPNSYVAYDDDELNNDVVFWIRFDSSPDVSDGDCGFAGTGACQVDDITVNLLGLYSNFEDFEGGALEDTEWSEFIDGNFVGDFSNLANNLGDLDDCRTNPSYQVNFVDTGFYEPDLSPQQGLTFEYGPFGYIVQNQGGLTHDEDYHTHNSARSPIMPWPDQDMSGCLIEWTGYSHEPDTDTSAGIYYTFGIRSTRSDDPADIELTAFKSDGYVYFGGPNYINTGWECSDQMVPGRKWVQIQLEAWELGYIWGIDGVDGTPAPYFDNCKFWVYPVEGPTISTRTVDMAQDNFPTIGTIDETDLTQNSIRFDMAQDVNDQDTFNIPGDSITFDITPVRNGAVLARNPRLYYKLKPNALYDPIRQLPPTGDYVEGHNPDGSTWAFDLPDTGFLFPGDVLHYYIQGIDHSPTGDWADATTVLPADTTGFSNFSGPLVYPSDFVVRGLPTMWDAGGGNYAYPPVLFWNDFENRGGENEWHYALNNLGLNEGVKYDTYYTHAASSGIGNGLGGRATISTIDMYTDILYTSGNFSTLTLSNGDPTTQGDAGDDIGLLSTWLQTPVAGGGTRDLFMTGDDLINDLTNAGTDQVGFLNEYVGVTLVQENLRPAIEWQSAPLVRTMPGSPVFATIDSWLVYGGCLDYNTFDGVETTGSAVQLAEFVDPNGMTGQYTFSAATLYTHPTVNSRVISLPYDLMFVYTNQNDGSKEAAGLSARARLLNDVLVYFGVPFTQADATPTPNALEPFRVRNFPNPFNPTTKIEYNMPERGHLSVKIYNVRGELVRTLVDGPAEQGPGFVMWDGTNSAGAAQASGVYFYEARAAGEVKVSKMALVK